MAGAVASVVLAIELLVTRFTVPAGFARWALIAVTPAAGTVPVAAIAFAAAVAITAPGLATASTTRTTIAATVTAAITATVAALFADFPLVQEDWSKGIASDDAFVAPYSLNRVVLGDALDTHPHRAGLENHQVPDLEF